MSEQME